jgi:hypothetical protein
MASGTRFRNFKHGYCRLCGYWLSDAITHGKMCLARKQVERAMAGEAPVAV